MRGRAWRLGAAGLALSIAAASPLGCAGVWGFDDLTLRQGDAGGGDAVPRDAVSRGDAFERGETGAIDGAGPSDSARPVDGAGPSDSARPVDGAGPGDSASGDAVRPVDAAEPNDTGPRGDSGGHDAGADGSVGRDASQPDTSPPHTDSGHDAPPPPADAACGGGWKEQAKVFDGGAQQATMSAVWGASATDVYAVGYDPSGNGVIVHSAGDGVWARQSLGTYGASQILGAVWGSSASDVYAAGSDGVLHTTGDGSWSGVSTPGGDYVSLWGSGANDVYAVGSGMVIHTTGNGSWSILTTAISSSATLTGVWGSGPDDVYVVGGTPASKPLIAHYKGSGSVFAPETVPSSTSFADWLVSVWGSGAGDVYAVTTNGTLYHSTGDGTWKAQVVAKQINYDYFFIWGSGPSDVYVTTTGSQLLHSTGDGTWQSITIDHATQLTTAGLWGSGPCDVYVTGDDDLHGGGVILHGP